MTSNDVLFVFFFLGATSTLGNAFQGPQEVDKAGVRREAPRPATSTVNEDRAQSAVHNSDPDLGEPTRDHPVACAAALEPARVRRGDQLTLVVAVKTAPGWHIYSTGNTGGSGIATTLSLKRPRASKRKVTGSCRRVK